MQQIIDEVLKAEKNAEKKIQEARRSVTELKKRIESENSQKISMAQNEAQKLSACVFQRRMFVDREHLCVH